MRNIVSASGMLDARKRGLGGRGGRRQAVSAAFIAFSNRGPPKSLQGGTRVAHIAPQPHPLIDYVTRCLYALLLSLLLLLAPLLLAPLLLACACAALLHCACRRRHLLFAQQLRHHAIRRLHAVHRDVSRSA